jgi:hypothetical protein
VDSGASKHMIGFQIYLTKLIENISSLQVELIGDNSRNAIKGVGEASYHLGSNNSIFIKDVFFCTMFNEESSFFIHFRRSKAS